ncbi:hypothetical protein CEXT_337521 [Caerostris extrusa]|uniref:Uncharacterized protein n=1 Tax=Caerostris extrusa TaxID=172846 RepID=A0AAV4SV27_CAEEX|nr:hypothetical protein CEXT_337521 [Caerostris extrusa]
MIYQASSAPEAIPGEGIIVTWPLIDAEGVLMTGRLISKNNLAMEKGISKSTKSSTPKNQVSLLATAWLKFVKAEVVFIIIHNPIFQNDKDLALLHEMSPLVLVECVNGLAYQMC